MKESVKSILIEDNQFITRNGLTALIEQMSGFSVISRLNESVELRHQISKEAPDLLIINFCVDSARLINTKTIGIANFGVNTLAIVSSDQQMIIQQLLKNGTKGIVTHLCSEEEITNAINTVSQGNRFYCNRILDFVIEDKVEKKNASNSTLSDREFEVLKCIAQGLSTNQIADILHVSHHTINSHRKNILKKLNLKSPAELIVYALENGLR